MERYTRKHVGILKRVGHLKKSNPLQECDIAPLVFFLNLDINFGLNLKILRCLQKYGSGKSA